MNKYIAITAIFLASYAFSANYVMTKSTFSTAGNSNALSTHYILRDAAGQSVTGQSTSLNRIEQAGFYTFGKKVIVGTQETPIIPKVFSLERIWPNPVADKNVTVKYGVPRTSNVSIKVYNVAGSVVKTLVSGEQKPGMYNIVWNGNTESGQRISQGVYFVRMIAPEFKATKKLVLVK